MITDPTNSLYPDDEPSHHRRNYVPWSRPDADILGDIRRVTVTHDGPRYAQPTHEGCTLGDIIREYGRLYGAGAGEYSTRMREHMQRLRDQAFNLGIGDGDMDAIERAVRRQLLGVDGIASLDVDDDTREWEAIDPRRRQAIANWTMTDRGRSGLLGKGDYPPGALVRNPPGFYTPEAHP